MARVRLIARLDIKGPKLIKGIHLEGLRVVGDPQEHAVRYYREGADELVYMDTVASLYGRNNLTGIVREAAREVFIPMTVGGGVRSVEDAYALLRNGADKVAINTGAVKRPELITEVARRFGSQCMVLSIEAKRFRRGPEGARPVPVGERSHLAGIHWEAYTDNGREHTGLDVVAWARRGVELGAGEILLTSVDQEGTQMGFDVELTAAVAAAVGVPVIACGGMGTVEHLADVVKRGRADAAAFAHVLHYRTLGLPELRAGAKAAGIEVRAA